MVYTTMALIQKLTRLGAAGRSEVPVGGVA